MVLDEVNRRALDPNSSRPQNIFEHIANQKNYTHRESLCSNQLTHFIAAEQRKQQEEIDALQKKNIKKISVQEFPIFFKYCRMNEISMTITYFHENNSFLNSKELKVKLKPFISHYKFLPPKKMFDNYENHCKKVFIS